ncbi:Protein CBG02903 [Caenorhabditis briggsae]|uniref:Protein CBG02903 n=1 Tax=Caenorhabditis briggsae TaxID=6238 RepID=A8WT91_CAEBR|nr:Protein CBG02903 [Caenorhabditis briggsae]CAP23702.1 Protein CBG02903 [Caenorhabditis briggsae]
MLEVRRASLVRQMAFRQDSNDAELAIRHGHLAPPNSIPDSPRPQKPMESIHSLTRAAFQSMFQPTNINHQAPRPKRSQSMWTRKSDAQFVTIPYEFKMFPVSPSS